MRDKIRLAKNLKFILQKKNSSLSSLAKRAGINTSTLHNYLEGITPKHIKSLLQIANLCDVTIDELLFSDISEKDDNPRQNEKHVYRLEITLKDERR